MRRAICAVYVERSRGPSVLPKTKRNRAVLLRTGFTTVWRSEIHICLKIGADAGVSLGSAIRYITCNKGREGSMLVSALASTLYAV
jgi:3-methyladenine DNA glycosylase Mpg